MLVAQNSNSPQINPVQLTFEWFVVIKAVDCFGTAGFGSTCEKFHQTILSLSISSYGMFICEENNTQGVIENSIHTGLVRQQTIYYA